VVVADYDAIPSDADAAYGALTASSQIVYSSAQAAPEDQVYDMGSDFVLAPPPTAEYALAESSRAAAPPALYFDASGFNEEFGDELAEPHYYSPGSAACPEPQYDSAGGAACPEPQYDSAGGAACPEPQYDAIDAAAGGPVEPPHLYDVAAAPAPLYSVATNPMVEQHYDVATELQPTYSLAEPDDFC
jgi:hypothetical protein